MNRVNTFRKLVLPLVAIASLFLAQACGSSYQISEVTQDAIKKWNSTVTIDSLPITNNLLRLAKDEKLIQLVNEAIQNNNDLQATALRLEASDYMLAETRSTLMPNANLGATKGRGNQSLNPLTGKQASSNSNNLSFNFAWEIDIWGKLYENHSAAVLNWEAQKQEFINIKDALAARVVQGWINSVSSLSEVNIRIKKLADIKNSFLTLKKKYTEGLVELNEYNESATEFELAKSELQTAKESYARNVRSLEILLGRMPETKLIPDTNLPFVDKPVVAIPAEALKNRPDVKAAVARLNASLKLSSVAKKELLPSLSLSADMFKESANISDVTGATLIWNVIGRLTQPIFQGGRLLNRAKAAGLEAEAVAADVEQVVLKSLKEIEDVLGAERELTVSAKSYLMAMENSKANETFYENKYRNGLVPFRVLLEARKLASETEIRFNQIKAERLINRIQLSLALGYGINENGDI